MQIIPVRFRQTRLNNIINKVEEQNNFKQIQFNNNIYFTKDNCAASYFLAFNGVNRKYMPKNDLQLNNIRKNYKEGNIKIDYTNMARINEKELIEKFLAGEDKNLDINRILGSNGTTYIIKDEQNNAVVIKAQHIEQDGRYPDMVTRWKYPDFDTEYAMLSKLPPDINSTTLIADINVKGKDARHLLAISYIDSTRLIDTPSSLSKESLKNLYNSFFELDKKGLFHRDLNATNLVVKNKTNRIFIIDYGAGKTFDKMHELENKADEIAYDTKQEERKNSPDINKLADLKQQLKQNIKYRRFKGVELSNLENFESLGFLPVLMILNRKLPLSEGKEYINHTDKLFLEHLQLSSDYHKKRLDILDKNSEAYKNEKILADVLAIINPDIDFENDKNAELVKDIATIELFRIKMVFAHKASRLYTDSDQTNYKIAAYWSNEFGADCAFAKQNLNKLSEKYKDNKLLSDYIKLNTQITDFYQKEIYPFVHNRVSSEAFQTYTEDKIKFNNDRTIIDGNWLDSDPNIFAPSCFIPKAVNERTRGMFYFC